MAIPEVLVRNTASREEAVALSIYTCRFDSGMQDGSSAASGANTDKSAAANERLGCLSTSDPTWDELSLYLVSLLCVHTLWDQDL